MSLAEQMRRRIQSPKYPNADRPLPEDVEEYVIQKNLKRRLDGIRKELEFEADCGRRECVIRIGVVGAGMSTKLRLRACKQFLANEGFSVEESTAHFCAESRGEYKVEQYLIVKW